MSREISGWPCLGMRRHRLIFGLITVRMYLMVSKTGSMAGRLVTINYMDTYESLSVELTHPTNDLIKKQTPVLIIAVPHYFSDIRL